ncbi:MAG: protein translocase subunit SecD [Dehalococcoidia bacterium]|nr:protein translocase subunit SecD [Dehalococcoidia bacterium]
MRSPSTLALFLFVVVLTGFAVVAVWPSTPNRYLPGDFWPEGRGIKIGDWERETMRLGLDLRGGSRLVVEADPPEDYEGDIGQAVESARDVFERRVNSLGTSEAEISKVSGNRIEVQVPGISLTDAQNLIGTTAQLRLFTFDETGQLVPATGNINGEEIQFTGEHLKSNTYPARQGTDFVVNFETTGRGSDLFEQITAKAVQFGASDPRRQLVFFLDDQAIGNPAVVQSIISDQGQLTGQDSFGAARDLSRQLNAGALPIPFRVIASSEVSATLGEDSVQQSVHAGEVGLLAVALFMILYYRLLGFLAACALGVYTAITLMIFKLGIPGGEPITLTLSGIAAFVLSVGMAVDANILIFERMKEELRRGHTLNRAIDIGFHRAWSSIRDSNISTFITCAILYWFGDQFGASLVKGFSLTLAIGVAVSMFSAITVSRTFLKMVVGTPLAKNRWLFNATETRTTLPAGRTAGSTGA